MKATNPPHAFGQGMEENLCHILAAEVMAARPDLAATETGQLVSLSLSLPPGQFDRVTAPRAECQWLSPEESRHGSGEAVRLDGDLGQGFQQLRAQWTFLGDGAKCPFGFFTYPPPNSPDRPALWVPKVAIRRSAEGLSVILSMWRGHLSIAAVMDEWMALLSAMLTPVMEQDGEGGILAMTAHPDPEQWHERVRATSQAITEHQFEKVVLARQFQIVLAKPPTISALVHRLTAINPQCRTFALPHRQGSVVASTPEILASKHGRQVVAHALAGTAKRHDSEGESQAAAARLLVTAKERHEHDVVATAISSQLKALCQTVHVPPEPTIMALRFVQHLWTPVSGTLRPEVGLLDVVERLHPTPAVLGSPREAAALWLERIGERRDGLYSGVAGWIDGAGDGEAAMVLRSAFIEGGRATLWAGAGIMADSLPEAELAEIDLKIATMLEVLRS